MTAAELLKRYPTPIRTFGAITVARRIDDEDDYRCDLADEDPDESVNDIGWQFRLGHQCDAWLIGDKQAAILFHRDLTRAIEWAQRCDAEVTNG